MWDMGSDVIQIVRSWADDQDSDAPARHVLLIPNVLVYCDEDFKLLFSQGQQLPILLAAESCVSNGLTFMTAVGKQELDLLGDRLSPRAVSFQCGGQARPGFFNRRDSFGPGYTGEIFQKLRQRPPVLQIICQRLERNSRSAKDGFTAEDSRVADNYALGHIVNLLAKF
jgi:hypothetical protein